MRSLLVILCAILLASCKSSFIKRKYMDGYFISRTVNIHSKSIDGVHPTLKKFEPETIEVIESSKANGDTIILVSKKSIPCRVETITRKKITYTYGSNPFNKMTIRTKKVSSIHFSGHQREYFRERHPDGNPILQHGLLNNGDEKNLAIGVIGYISLMIASIVGIIASPIFIMFTILSLVMLILYTTINQESTGFKVLNGIGKFFGFSTLIILGAMLLGILIAMIVFLG